MPELPEVETTRQGIAPYLKDQSIRTIQVRDRRLRWPIDGEIAERFKGKTIQSITRRAKYLLVGCEEEHYLIIHLGMSGSLRVVESNEAINKHDHFDISLSNQFILRYHDPRRFGALLWCEGDPEQHKLLQALGPEPLGADFDPLRFYQNSRQKRLPIKQYIMDNHNVVGVGNIYANESLFLAGIRPGRAAGRVTQVEFKRLHQAIIQVLTAAIKQGGTTLKDFRGGDGKPGYFQLELNVYGLNGQPCHQCHTPIKEKRIGQRNSFYCPQCQS